MSGERFLQGRDPWVWAVPALCVALAAALAIVGANQEVFFWFNALSRHTGEAPWAVITALGDGLVVFSLALLWAGRWPVLLWALLWTGLVGGIYVHGLKEWVDLARPAAGLADTSELVIIGAKVKWYSFPSGHSAAAFALAGLLCLRRQTPPWLRVAVVTAAAVVAASRMVVGAHWPMDVLAGAAGGWLAAVAGIGIARRWGWGLKLGVQRALALLLLAAVMVLVFAHDSGYPQARAAEVLLGVGVLVGALPGLWRLFHHGASTAGAPR